MTTIERRLEVDFNNIDEKGRVRVPLKYRDGLSYGDIVLLRSSLDQMEITARFDDSTNESLLFTILH
jgi:DNA-binding transcriptional regulator/RsmH inhibitor MraZ